MRPPESASVLGVRIDAVSCHGATTRVLAWARARESRYVCFGVAASLMEAHDSPQYREVLAEAALVVPDGMPLVCMLKWQRIGAATRVYGPDVTRRVLEAAANVQIPVGFLGGTPQALTRLVDWTRHRFPAIQVAFAVSPPFRAATAEEDADLTRNINRSGVRILFVGLGGAKQDHWMHSHRGKVQCVMLGVGAAFDFLSGVKPQAPLWMQSTGLEWLFRLAIEPRRLWRRYLLQNPRFVALAFAQIVSHLFSQLLGRRFA